MDFLTEIKARPAAEIVAAIRAPERTVYSWKMGERLPPAWVQWLILKSLSRKGKAARGRKGRREAGAAEGE